MIYDIIKQFYILITDSVYLWARACTPRACISRSYNMCETCVPILHMSQRPDIDDSVLIQCVTLPQSVTQCGRLYIYIIGKKLMFGSSIILTGNTKEHYQLSALGIGIA